MLHPTEPAATASLPTIDDIRAAAREMVPRLASLWVQTIVKTIGNALEGSNVDIAVEFTSLSKTYSMPGWRMGFAVGNERLIQALTRVKSYLDYGAFTPIQVAATAALNGPQDCIDEIRGIYRRRRDCLVDAVSRAGREILRRYRRPVAVTEKADRSPLTEADRAARAAFTWEAARRALAGEELVVAAGEIRSADRIFKQ